MSNVSTMRTAAAQPATLDTVWMSPRDVCNMLPGVTLDMLKARRKRLQDPPFHKPTGHDGKVVLYDREDILAWVKGSRVKTRGDAA